MPRVVAAAQAAAAAARAVRIAILRKKLKKKPEKSGHTSGYGLVDRPCPFVSFVCFGIPKTTPRKGFSKRILLAEGNTLFASGVCHELGGTALNHLPALVDLSLDRQTERRKLHPEDSLQISETPFPRREIRGFTL